MDHLLRNGHRVVVNSSNQKLSNTSKVMVSAAAVSKPEINKELCKPAEFFAMPSIASASACNPEIRHGYMPYIASDRLNAGIGKV
ncbi:hypothetical protein [Pseudomonas syringae]|uniref:hypothetical protein n=1 Tax=Pseudomonas syringae TaxID=317 RepID=UPI00280635DC|nr:hypothetical protein [Pseudomonas syringae]